MRPFTPKLGFFQPLAASAPIFNEIAALGNVAAAGPTYNASANERNVIPITVPTGGIWIKRFRIRMAGVAAGDKLRAVVYEAPLATTSRLVRYGKDVTLVSGDANNLVDLWLTPNQTPIYLAAGNYMIGVHGSGTSDFQCIGSGAANQYNAQANAFDLSPMYAFGTISSFASQILLQAPYALTSGPAPVQIRSVIGSANTNSAGRLITLPAGSRAGDRIFMDVHSAWDVSSITGITGWTALNTNVGTQWNGRIYTKILTSGDITTGGVTVNFSGNHGSYISLIVMVGNCGIRYTTASRVSTNFTSIPLSTDSSPQVGDTVVWIGTGRSVSGVIVTSDRGQHMTPYSATTNASGRIFYEDSLTVGGVLTATFSFAGVTQNGGGCGVLVLYPL
jgi:hypothetical protein